MRSNKSTSRFIKGIPWHWDIEIRGDINGGEPAVASLPSGTTPQISIVMSL